MSGEQQRNEPETGQPEEITVPSRRTPRPEATRTQRDAHAS